MSKILSFFAILLIKIYKLLPLPHVCRFYPTCSTYTLQAIKKYGFFKGVWLGIKRVSRCHPFSDGGYDPLE